MAKNKVQEGELLPKDVGGRPTKFKSSYCIELEDMMAQGYTDARIMAHWGIGKSTFYRWLRDNEDFKASHEKGLEKAEAWWEEFGLAGMTGKIPKFNSTMWIAFMNNKFHWSRREGGDSEKGTQINIGNMQVLQNLQQLSDGELDLKIQHLLKDLNLDETQNSGRDQEGTSSPTSREGSAEEV